MYSQQMILKQTQGENGSAAIRQNKHTHLCIDNYLHIKVPQ